MIAFGIFSISITPFDRVDLGAARDSFPEVSEFSVLCGWRWGLNILAESIATDSGYTRAEEHGKAYLL